MLIFFHILVLQEYWVLTESRILLKPVLGGLRNVALSNNSHEQIQLNQVCCFLILPVLPISERSVFPDYFGIFYLQIVCVAVYPQTADSVLLTQLTLILEAC